MRRREGARGSLSLRKAGTEAQGKTEFCLHAYLTMDGMDDPVCQVGERCLQES